MISKKSTLILALALLYGYLFFNLKLGLNVLFFDACFLLALVKIRPELAQSTPFTWTTAGLLVSSLSVVIVNTNLSVFAHGLSFILLLGYVQVRELRFIWFAFLLGLFSLVQGPARWLRNWHSQRNQVRQSTQNSSLPWLKQILAPLLLLLPFVALYSAANSQFAYGVEQFFLLFSNWSISLKTWRFVFLIVIGIFLVSAAIFPRIKPSIMANKAADFRDDLQRGLTPQFRSLLPGSPLRLKNEYRRAALTFGLLNVLLLLVNLTDFRFVWLATGELSAHELSHFVHLGTYNLIASILLAMAVVLYFFRANLNFLPNAPLLRPLANAWLIQNAILVFSVGIRNHHYIREYGLAYGRIYVLFFLLLILFGLFTLARKVNRKLTISYLFQSNGMAAWLCLLLFAAINWDGVITRYNVAQKTAHEVDWHYLTYELGDHNTFLLVDHLADQKRYREHGFYKLTPQRYRIKDWRAWNYADYRNYRAVVGR